MQFWTLQVAGWLGLCVVTFLSLTLWYNSVALDYIQHTLVQAGLGLVLSLGMRSAFRAAWQVPPVRRAALGGTTVVLASFAWTVLRIGTFEAITGEEGVWADFGGWYFASLLVMLSWALAYHGIKFYQLMTDERARAQEAQAKAARERVRRLTAERLSQDAHLRMLRYQINPHFMFNTLNSVSSLIETGRGTTATQMISELSRFLRATLRDDVPLRTTLATELETLGAYLAIERKRFGDRLDLKLEVAPDALGVQIPSLLLQPLVENSIKHVVARTSTLTTIQIEAERDENLLRLAVSNSNEKHEPVTERAGCGVGLTNVVERLDAEYGPLATFRSQASDSGQWRTEITLPIQTSADG